MVKRNRGNCGRIEARKKDKIGEKACTMIRYTSEKQGRLEGFETGLERELDGNNRWVRLAASIPWDGLAEGYYRKMSSKAGRPAKDARLVIGAVIVKHKLCLSDEETVRQIPRKPVFAVFCRAHGVSKGRAVCTVVVCGDQAADGRGCIFAV